MMRAIIATILIVILVTGAAAETELWVLCQPDSYVNIRFAPKTNSEKTGYLMLGDKVLTDGKRKNGFTHILGYTEAGEGWVHTGFLIEDEPVIRTQAATINSKGRVACRRSVNGTRRHWLKNGDSVRVYARGLEWCITDKGFVKTAFLGLE